MVRHAIDPGSKQVRRAAILAAAGSLFDVGDGSLPSAAEIAVAAGLAKGTVYLYFRTKEEIFAALLLEGWGDVLGEIVEAFQDAKGSRAAKIATFLDTYLRQLDRRPALLRLDALGYGVLERNMDPAELRTFKLALLERLTSVGAVVDRVLGLPHGRGLRLLTRTYALTRGLWQSLQPGRHGEVASDPAFALLYPDLGRELREALAEYWRGALAPPRPAGRAPARARRSTRTVDPA